jgi:hypothetical protein
MERHDDERGHPPGLFFQLGIAAKAQWKTARDDSRCTVNPKLDGDRDHVHFEISDSRGDSLLWLTISRGTESEIVVSSLRKIADLIDRHGLDLQTDGDVREQSDGTPTEDSSGPLRLEYDYDGNLVLPRRRG